MKDIIRLGEIGDAINDLILFYNNLFGLLLDLKALKDPRVEQLFNKYTVVVKKARVKK